MYVILCRFCQAMDGPLQAAGPQHQLQRTAARLAAQLRAAQASQLQQEAKLQQLTQQLEAMDQQQAAAGGAETLQPPPATAAAAEGERRPTAGMDVQDLFLKVGGVLHNKCCLQAVMSCHVLGSRLACMTLHAQVAAGACRKDHSAHPG